MVTACSTPPAAQSANTASPTLSDCVARGGFIDRRGRMRSEICVTPFADAGKTCTDKSQCLGACILKDTSITTGAPAAGKCQADNRLFGCYATVVVGKATGGICVD